MNIDLAMRMECRVCWLVFARRSREIKFTRFWDVRDHRFFRSGKFACFSSLVSRDAQSIPRKSLRRRPIGTLVIRDWFEAGRYGFCAPRSARGAQTRGKRRQASEAEQSVRDLSSGEVGALDDAVTNDVRRRHVPRGVIREFSNERVVGHSVRATIIPIIARCASLCAVFRPLTTRWLNNATGREILPLPNRLFRGSSFHTKR